MSLWSILALWITIWVIQIVFGVIAVRQQLETPRPSRHYPLLLSALSSIPPLVGMVLFAYVFVIGRSSNVAQLTGRHDLWKLWCDAWLYLMLGIPIAQIASVFALLLPPHELRAWPSLASRGLAILVAGLSFICVVSHFPDA